MSSQETTQTGQTAQSSQTSQWAGGLAAAVGLWVLITPFFWGGDGGAGTINWLFWSNVVSGIVIAGLAGYAASQSSSKQADGASGVAALAGVWVLITPFFWGAGSAGFDWLFWSNIASGIVVAALAGWTAIQQR